MMRLCYNGSTAEGNQVQPWLQPWPLFMTWKNHKGRESFQTTLGISHLSPNSELCYEMRAQTKQSIDPHTLTSSAYFHGGIHVYKCLLYNVVNDKGISQSQWCHCSSMFSNSLGKTSSFAKYQFFMKNTSLFCLLLSKCMTEKLVTIPH